MQLYTRLFLSETDAVFRWAVGRTDRTFPHINAAIFFSWPKTLHITVVCSDNIDLWVEVWDIFSFTLKAEHYPVKDLFCCQTLNEC